MPKRWGPNRPCESAGRYLVSIRHHAQKGLEQSGTQPEIAIAPNLWVALHACRKRRH